MPRPAKKTKHMERAGARLDETANGPPQADAAQHGEGVEDAKAQQAMTTTLKTMKVRSALTVDHRDDKILAQRLAFAVRNVSRYGTVELGVETAGATGC